MVKKIAVFLAILTVAVIFVIPLKADPTDVVLDQPVTLMIPARFTLVDRNNDQLAEAIQARIRIRSYREGDFVLTGKMEAKRDEAWIEVAQTTKPFQWSPANDTAELTFTSQEIRSQKRSGPYRVSVSLQDGDWKLPLQVIGFTPKYQWDNFARVRQR
ncbi:MAG: hypothetical protein PVG90_00405 [Bacillota bacterium]|jgi:hypothetical protein